MTVIQRPKAYRIDSYEQFMAHLAQARDDQELTWAEIGQRAGCYLQQAHNWVNGGAECRARRLFDLAHALGYDLALIPREDT